ncbi:MAG: UDP-galactose-lipid carrier transferase [Acidimicrobiales bacterium]|nr:UDP-galactose-lipid carrier transferase [Acidimicrobiales bacterium]
MSDHRHRWIVEPGHRPDLSKVDTGSTAGAPGDKQGTKPASEKLLTDLADLQLRLWAEHQRSVLFVLQAMDAGGKDGTIRKVFTGVNPQGVRVASFKAPSTVEREHDFLWRVHSQVPGHGEIGVFNRSHYEDVLIARVDEIVPAEVWKRRYRHIRNFEQNLTDAGTTVVKVFLHISKEEQKKRFQARLDDKTKRWKFSAGDLAVRAKWDAYQEAFADALEKTSTADEPWYIVPADRKWYRDWAVLNILVETLRSMDPEYPAEEPGLAHIVIE